MGEPAPRACEGALGKVALLKLEVKFSGVELALN
jgi:hypothetical protein